MADVKVGNATCQRDSIVVYNGAIMCSIMETSSTETRLNASFKILVWSKMDFKHNFAKCNILLGGTPPLLIVPNVTKKI